MKRQNKVSANGLLLALLTIPVGIVLWVTLWNMGFMASLVAFVIAYGAVWLYKTQTGGHVSKPAAYSLIAIIITGVVLSFISGMVADGWAYFSEATEGATLLSREFLDFISDNLSSVEIWSAYQNDLILAVVFGLIGAGYELYKLFVPDNTNTTKSKK